MIYLMVFTVAHGVMINSVKILVSDINSAIAWLLDDYFSNLTTLSGRYEKQVDKIEMFNIAFANVDLALPTSHDDYVSIYTNTGIHFPWPVCIVMYTGKGLNPLNNQMAFGYCP